MRSPLTIFASSLFITNKFHLAMGLLSQNSVRTSLTNLLVSPAHVPVIFTSLRKRCTATWNVFVKYISDYCFLPALNSPEWFLRE